MSALAVDGSIENFLVFVRDRTDMFLGREVEIIFAQIFADILGCEMSRRQFTRCHCRGESDLLEDDVVGRAFVDALSHGRGAYLLPWCVVEQPGAVGGFEPNVPQQLSDRLGYALRRAIRLNKNGHGRRLPSDLIQLTALFEQIWAEPVIADRLAKRISAQAVACPLTAIAEAPQWATSLALTSYKAVLYTYVAHVIVGGGEHERIESLAQSMLTGTHHLPIGWRNEYCVVVV